MKKDASEKDGKEKVTSSIKYQTIKYQRAATEEGKQSWGGVPVGDFLGSIREGKAMRHV